MIRGRGGSYRVLVSRTGSFFEEEEADACVADGGANGCEIRWFSEKGGSDDAESSKLGSPRPSGDVGFELCGGRDVQVRGNFGGVLDG